MAPFILISFIYTSTRSFSHSILSICYNRNKSNNNSNGIKLQEMSASW